MMGDTHRLQGLAVGLATAPLFVPNLWAGVVYVGVTTLTALLPDIDHHGSTVTKSLGPITKSISWLIRLVSCHRGLTHSALGIGALTLVLAAFLPTWVAIAVAVGCFTHVLGDALTRAGVYLWWPSRSKFRLMTLKTGGKLEKWAVVPITFVAIVALIGHLLWQGTMQVLS